MAVTSVTEDFTGLGADDNVADDGTATGRASRFFDVEFDGADTPADRPIIALTTAAVDPSTSVAVPLKGEAHPFANNLDSDAAWLYVVNRSCEVKGNSPQLFRVTINYTQVENPLLQAPIIEWLSASTREPIDTDILGNAIVNSSDEPFDPPPKEDFDDLLLRATWNIRILDANVLLAYKGAVNTDNFNPRGSSTGFSAGQAKVMVFVAREIKAISGNFYVELVAEIQFRSDGWKRKFIDQGYRIKTGTDSDDNPTYSQITDDEGNLITEPVLLDGSGQKLGETDPVVRVEFNTKPQLPFGFVFGVLT